MTPRGVFRLGNRARSRWWVAPGTVRRLIRLAGVVMIFGVVLSGCASLTGTLARSAPDYSPEGGSASPAGAPTGDEDATSPEERLFSTPEGSVVSTPWFTVSSVILRVRRVQRETVIVLPEESIMRDYMRFDPNVVLDSEDILPNGQLMFGLGFVTDGVPAFATEPDRYRYPELYD